MLLVRSIHEARGQPNAGVDHPVLVQIDIRGAPTNEQGSEQRDGRV